MKKIILLLIPFLLFWVSCGERAKEKAEIKTMSLKAVNEYCESTFGKENKLFEVKEVSSCLISGSQAVSKVDIIVKEDGYDAKKFATVVCEKENNVWQVKSVVID